LPIADLIIQFEKKTRRLTHKTTFAAWKFISFKSYEPAKVRPN